MAKAGFFTKGGSKCEEANTHELQNEKWSKVGKEKTNLNPIN